MAKRTTGTQSSLILLLALVAGLFLTSGRGEAPPLVEALAWGAIAFAAERLWHPARDGRTVISMAPAAQLPLLAFVAPPWSLALLAPAAFFGHLRRPGAGARSALGYAAGSTAAGAAALGVLTAFPRGEGTSPFPLLGAVAAAGLALLAVAQGAAAWRAARAGGTRFGAAWREAFGYGTEVMTAGALLVVAALAVLGYAAVGFRGVLLCVMPLLFVRDGSRRYLELRRAQARTIDVERLAAKGEMAAEIGHELNNYLSAISGRAQLLGMSADLAEDDEALRDVEQLRDQSVRMATLARGLMDFSHRETRRTRMQLGDLVQRTVELVRPHARFRDVVFDVRSEAELPDVEMDPGQIQQVLLTLLRRVAGAAAPGRRELVVSTLSDPRRRGVAIQIIGNRTVPPPPRSEAADDPESDSDLGTVTRIVERHQGRFDRGIREDHREGYRVVLPAA